MYFAHCFANIHTLFNSWGNAVFQWAHLGTFSQQSTRFSWILCYFSTSYFTVFSHPSIKTNHYNMVLSNKQVYDLKTTLIMVCLCGWEQRISVCSKEPPVWKHPRCISRYDSQRAWRWLVQLESWLSECCL